MYQKFVLYIILILYNKKWLLQKNIVPEHLLQIIHIYFKRFYSTKIKQGKTRKWEVWPCGQAEGWFTDRFYYWLQLLHLRPVRHIIIFLLHLPLMWILPCVWLPTLGEPHSSLYYTLTCVWFVVFRRLGSHAQYILSLFTYIYIYIGNDSIRWTKLTRAWLCPRNHPIRRYVYGED